ncbi:hypothetical protein AVEN_46113-1 [Araneus ventricosus]|uniref:Uncharacterized protein n=1 Tax=Araneus ventricosus TaxID=182803 RepID=A0A4Y2R4R0_ARAVE|nr:hypothetical protein AVEN_46113-1 [Araneus ventricosus]
MERILLYGAPAWAKNITSRQQRLFNSIQRKFVLNITGAYSTTPTTVLQVIEGITPLHIKLTWSPFLLEYVASQGLQLGRLKLSISRFSSAKSSYYQSSSSFCFRG